MAASESLVTLHDAGIPAPRAGSAASQPAMSSTAWRSIGRVTNGRPSVEATSRAVIPMQSIANRWTRR